MLGSWYLSGDTHRFITISCKNAEAGYLESGPATALLLPLWYALLFSGLSPNLTGGHGSGERCVQKNWSGYYHTGSQPSIPFFSESPDRGLRLEERQEENLV